MPISSTHRATLALAEWLRRTADRIDPARVSRSFRRLGRNPSAPDLANLCSLLQRHQNAPVAGQRCTGLSSHSVYRNHQLARDPRRTSSLLRSGLGFRYTQAMSSPKSAAIRRALLSQPQPPAGAFSSRPACCASPSVPVLKVRLGSALAIATLPLYHFDLVAVGVLDKKELDREPAAAAEFLDRSGIEAEPRTFLVLVFEIVDRDCEMPVAGPVGVGLAAPAINGKLNLKFAFPIA